MKITIKTPIAPFMFIFWVNGTGDVWAIQADGSSTGAIAPIVTGKMQIYAMTFDANFIYFVDSCDGTVWRVSK